MYTSHNNISLPHSVEHLITKICTEKSEAPPDTKARNQLASISEHSAIEILQAISNCPKITNSFSGYINFLVDKRKRKNAAVSPPKRVCTTINRVGPTTPPPPPNHNHNALTSTISPSSSGTTTTVRLMMSPAKNSDDASSRTSSPFKPVHSMMSPGSLKVSNFPQFPTSNFKGEYGGRFSPHLVALGELEFRKQFLILSYLGWRRLEDYLSVAEIREWKDLSMIKFETAVWEKIRKGETSVERLKNLDWDTGKTHIYHCHVSPDGNLMFKGPYLSKERTFLQSSLGDENVLLVKFCKEKVEGKNQLRIDDYHAMYNWVSKEGILVGLRRYRFFGFIMSSYLDSWHIFPLSVFKDGGKEERKKDPSSSGVKCYFVRMESDATIDINREYILKGKNIREARCVFMHLETLPSMAKYMARLSLILSKTMKLKIDLTELNVENIDEIYCRDADGNIVYDQDGEPRIHTDGTGFISEDLAAICPNNIFKGNLDNVESSETNAISRSSSKEPPLLIQFRLFYNGSAVKGTFLLNKELPVRTVMVRPSMIKVESDVELPITHAQNSLEVVSTSNPPKKILNLSRNLIALLSYGGVPEQFFLNLVDDALEKTKTVSTSRNAALRVALNNRQLDDHLAVHMVARGIPLDEPCLSNYLSIFNNNEKKNLRQGKIPIPECFYLMGTVDPTGKLNHDQVCIILEHGPISGKVLVYRHPGLHFGDIHVLTAIHVPGLENFVGNAKYAIFFPTKGPRSLADEMSGGDFDGDIFFVSRNPELLRTFRESERWVQKSSKLKAPNKRPRDFSDDKLEEELFKQFLTARFDPSLIWKLVPFWAFDVKDGTFFSYAVGVASDSWLAYIDRLLSRGVSSAVEKACIRENINRLVDIHSDALDAPKKSGMKIEIPYELKVNMFPHYMEREQGNTFISTSVLGLIYNKVKEHEARSDSEIEIWKLPQFNQEVPEAYMQIWKVHYAKYCNEMMKAMQLKDGEEKNAATDSIIRLYKQELYGTPEFEESKKSMDDLYGEALALYHIVYDRAKLKNNVGSCMFVWRVAGPVLLNLYASKQGEKQFLFTYSVIKELWG
ncbi:hypothetical protein ACFE04_016096 [Oxalis oulophora]